MSHSPAETETEFDAHAAEYDAVLARGIAISAEDKITLPGLSGLVGSLSRPLGEASPCRYGFWLRHRFCYAIFVE
jgi:hypothetical protein